MKCKNWSIFSLQGYIFIPLLEDGLKETMKLYLLDLGSMGQHVNIDDLEDEFKNVLKILEITNTKRLVI